jgi:outer membrane protein
MKNTLLVVVFAIVIVALSDSVSAQASKLAHISFQELVVAMPEYDSASVKLQRTYKDLEKELELLNVERNKKLDEYLKSRDNLTDLVRASREEELNSLGQRIQAFQQGAQESLQQEEEKLMQPVYEKARKAIETVAKEKGLDYVYDSQVLLYKASNTLDLLSDVKKHLGIKN